MIFSEGDFTVTLNLAAFDEDSVGQLTFSCAGPQDVAISQGISY